MYKILFFIPLSLLLMNTSCNNGTSPEDITEKFITYLADANCEDAINLTRGYATRYVSEMEDEGCTTFESNIVSIECETTDESAVCDCEEERNGISVTFKYKFKKQDGTWFISKVEGGATTEDIVKGYVEFMAAGDCESALALTDGEARENMEADGTKPCDSYTTSIQKIDCTTRENKSNCSVTELRGKKNENTLFELVPGGGLGWKITSIASSNNPNTLVRIFVTSLADGECDLALKLASGDARESVQATIDAGCEPYETEIVAVNCETSGEGMLCTCTERREGMDMTFNYDLKEVGEEWTVTNFAKDLRMDDLNLGE